MWVKLCGVQTVRRAGQLAELDPDALGINRYGPSSRYVELERAQALAGTIRSVDASIDLVGVYVNPDTRDLRRDHERVDWDVIQLHGEEPPEVVGQLGSLTRVMKAFSVDDDVTSDRLQPYDSWAYLLDAYHPDRYGGTGQTIPWDRIKDVVSAYRVVLSGGLTPDNVPEAIGRTRPFGVDVCSGIEDDDGFKDPSLSERFLEQVRETLTELP